MLGRVFLRVPLWIFKVHSFDVADGEDVLIHGQCLTITLQGDQVTLAVHPAHLFSIRGLDYDAGIVQEYVNLLILFLGGLCEL